MRDMMHLHVTEDLPIKARALPFADRIEVRFGKAFPAALLIDRAALTTLRTALTNAQASLEEADQQPGRA